MSNTNNGQRDREPANGETLGYWAKVETRLDRVGAARRITQPTAGSNPAAALPYCATASKGFARP